MKRLALLLLPCLLAAPAFAGTLYVPFAADFELGGMSYQTWVWATNHHTAEPATIEYLNLDTFTIGTDREDIEPVELMIPPGETMILVSEANQGMIEVFAPLDVYVQARLVPVGEDPAAGHGIEVPVISSDNVIPAGGRAHLLGWERRADGAEAYSNFGLLNLGHQEANCFVDVLRGDGALIADNVPLPLSPLSHLHFEHALSLLGLSEAVDWRTVVTCDQKFYSYLSLYYPTTGRLAFVGPAPSGASELQRPLGGGVSTQFDYISDLPIDAWGGLEIGPFIDSTGIDFHHPSGHPVGGYRDLRIQGVTYEKGISFYPKWSQVPYVEYQLGGQYALFTAVVRVDDFYTGKYEWAVVHPTTGRWERLERPSDGFRGVERTNPIRVGSAMTFQVKGDGVVLYQSPEIYAYGDPLTIEVDVRGVDVLRLEGHPDGTEQLGAPHRNGLSSARPVFRCPWLDLIDFADAKLFYAQ